MGRLARVTRRTASPRSPTTGASCDVSTGSTASISSNAAPQRAQSLLELALRLGGLADGAQSDHDEEACGVRNDVQVGTPGELLDEGSVVHPFGHLGMLPVQHLQREGSRASSNPLWTALSPSSGRQR